MAIVTGTLLALCLVYNRDILVKNYFKNVFGYLLGRYTVGMCHSYLLRSKEGISENELGK